MYAFWVLVTVSIFLGACGKHETTGGALGTTAGAIIGSSISSEKNKTTAAVIGGIIGNIVGASAGRTADEEEAEELRLAKKFARRERKFARHLEQVHKLQANLDRWCVTCKNQNTIPGAYRCTSCGDALVCEKFCSGCLTGFSPAASYRYCPYCRDRRILAYR